MREELLNRERLNYGMIEFFLFSAASIIITSMLRVFDENYLDGWLLWILILSYYLFYPILFRGKTIFMQVLKIDITVVNKSFHISRLLIITRILLKTLLFFTLIDAYHMLCFKKGIPLYDKILGIKLYK